MIFTFTYLLLIISECDYAIPVNIQFLSPRYVRIVPEPTVAGPGKN
jgi:hypothetical protein